METINICFFSSKKFLPMARTMVNSLVKNNSRQFLNLFFFSDEFTQQEAIKAFDDIISKNVCINFLPVNKSIINNIEENRAFSYYPYYKLFYYRILPIELDKILWLDIDLIVDADILELYKTEIGDAPLAACQEHVNNKGAFSKRIINEFDLDENGKYFNSGVMLMNLRVLREKDPADLMLSVAFENEDITHVDQDLFNIFFGKDIFELPKRYNFQPFKFVKNNETNEKPRIIHYIGKLKPDCYRYRGRVFVRYWTYVPDKPGFFSMLLFLLKHYWFVLSRGIFDKIRPLHTEGS